MKKRAFYALFTLALLLTSFISGCAGVGRIGSFFTNQEYKQYAKIIDFGLFFVIFFALCYLGFTKVWGEGFGKPGSARGAVIGLSLALSLALTFAIVTQTKFSITTIFPLAQAIFFLVIWFLLWGLLDKTKVLGEGYLAKIGYAIITFMFAYIVFSMLTHMICQMSDNMDDAACKSDFFNAGYTVLSRFFSGGGTSGGGGLGAGGGTSGGGGKGGGTTGGKTGTGGGTGGTGGTTPGGTTPTATGPIQGGCRLDITFEYNSDSTLTSAAPITDFVQKVKAMGVNKVHVYGYASKEGEANLNWGLAGRRAGTIASRIRSADPSISVSDSSKGATTIFDTSSYPPNRRVVIFTDSLSSVLPAPAAGTVYGCTPKNQTTNNQTNQATNNTIIPGAAGGSGYTWWPLLLLIPLLALWLLVRRRQHERFRHSISMKDHFLEQMRQIRDQKDAILGSIAVQVPTTRDEFLQQAQELIDTLEKELTDRRWYDMKTLSEQYAGRLNLIATQAVPYGVNVQHAEMIASILTELHASHPPPATLRDRLLFYRRLREIVADRVEHQNRKYRHFHDFFVLEAKLQHEIDRFQHNENMVITQYQRIHYSTFFGRRSGLTRHIVAKRSSTGKRRFPWVRTVPEEVEDVEQIGPTPVNQGLVAVTDEVRRLCRDLDSQINLVLAQRPAANHNNFTGLRTEYDREKEIMEQLRRAVDRQKRLMLEEWIPVIDRIDAHGRLKGSINALVATPNPPGEFLYQWWLFDDRDQFNEAYNNHRSPDALRAGTIGNRLNMNGVTPPAIGKRVEANITFDDDNNTFVNIMTHGRVLGLGACRVAAIPQNVQPHAADGHWKWENLQIGHTRSRVEIVATGPGTTNPVPGTHHTHNLGSDLTVTGIANAGASFREMIRTSSEPTLNATVTTNPTNFANLHAIERIEVIFEMPTAPISNVTIRVTGRGTTDPVPGTHTRVIGTDINLLATPNAGHEIAEIKRTSTNAAGVATVTQYPLNTLTTLANIQQTELIEVLFRKIAGPVANVTPIIIPHLNYKNHPPEYGVTVLRTMQAGMTMTPGPGGPAAGVGVPDLTCEISKSRNTEYQIKVDIYKKRANDPAINPDITLDMQLSQTPANPALSIIPWNPRARLGINQVESTVGRNVKLAKTIGPRLVLFTYVDCPTTTTSGDHYYIYYSMIDISGTEVDHNWIEFVIS